MNKTAKSNKVALFARAWIEISLPLLQELLRCVALFARAWIEITTMLCCYKQNVALFARAWIEI